MALNVSSLLNELVKATMTAIIFTHIKSLDASIAYNVTNDQFISYIQLELKIKVFKCINSIYHKYHKEQKNPIEVRNANKLDAIINNGKHITCVLSILLDSVMKLMLNMKNHFNELYQYNCRNITRAHVDLFINQYYGDVNILIDSISNPCLICNSYTYDKNVDLFKLE
jgi:hypothetical protein